jgi:alpha-tubulin suppressor-like RCC1 family protein
VAAGYGHTCALVNGDLWCWGHNASGELGDKTTAIASQPKQILSGVNITALAAGDANTCIVEGGAAKCWGEGAAGVLGNAPSPNLPDAAQAIPVANAGALVSAISVGHRHACAVVNGTARCWGQNEKGELGIGSTNAAYSATIVSNLPAVSEVSASYDHSCARESSAPNRLRCWGRKGAGQLGGGSDEIFLAPTSVPLGNMNSAKQVAQGYQHGCVLLVDGSIRCWGDNTLGQVGDANSSAPHYAPKVVSGIGGAAAIATGSRHSCAIVGGAAMCWGSNFAGQLGVGMIYTSSTPVEALSAQKSVKAIAGGSNHTCAIANDGTYCWGDNKYGQIGDPNDLSAHKAPYKILALANANVTAISAGDLHTCAIVDGGVKCWGNNIYGELGNPGGAVGQPVSAIPPGQNVTSIAAGSDHTCAVVSGGVQCWGLNNLGQLGDGTNQSSPTPIPSPDFIPQYGVTAVVAGGDHTCALAFGAMFCWGSGSYGELGTGTHDDWSHPIAPLGLGFAPGATVTGIAAGAASSCAIIDGGQHLNCWGSNSQGALGVVVNDYQSIALPVMENDVLFANRFEVKP